MNKNIIQNALNKIKKDEKCKPKCSVINIKGKLGPTGPTGPIGKGLNITGYYNSLDELKENHPIGSAEETYIVDDELYIWSENTQNWENIGKVKGPKGDIGPTGPAGPTLIKSAYIVTYNNLNNEEGQPVASATKIPLKRKELDIGDIIKLNSDYTISFNNTGYYKISFTVYAYPTVTSVDFDPTKDIVSIGFKETNTDKVYVGTSSWVWNGEAIEIYASGIIIVTDTNALYELTNLSKETIYLNTPSINNITSISYFSNSLVTLLIEYLGENQ